MPQEIERKFLVKNSDFKQQATKSFRIVQAFLSSVPQRTVRVRIKGHKAFLTIKGISNQTGTSRFEWEKEILVHEAEQLLTLCEPARIEKTRYIVPIADNLFFEIDEFFGENKGLVVAEIELETENQVFQKPKWLGIEVTGDLKYYNSNLSLRPFSLW